MEGIDWIWIVIICVLKIITALEDYSVPRMYTLNLTQSSWRDSRALCRQSGGQLATVYDYSTIPDLNLTHHMERTSGLFWVGLQTSDLGWVWDDGENLTWTNWAGPGPDGATPGDCAAASVTAPYSWVAGECDTPRPYLCQYPGGECRFTVHEDHSIAANNYMYLYQKTAAECQDACAASTRVTCQSFEYWPLADQCHFNMGNMWTLARFYTRHDRWVYYHRTCNTANITGHLLEITTTTTTTTTTTPTTTTTTQPTTTTTTTPTTPFECPEKIVTVTQTETLIVTSTHVIQPSPVFIFPSASLLLERPIEEELKEISEAVQERRKTLKKISVEDPRPSATYVGYVAIAFLSSVFGSIVLLDILTLFRNNPFCNKKSKKRTYQTKHVPETTEPEEPKPDTAATSAAKLLREAAKASRENLAKMAKESADDGQADESSVVLHRSRSGRTAGRLWKVKNWNIEDSGFDGSGNGSEGASSENTSWQFPPVIDQGEPPLDVHNVEVQMENNDTVEKLLSVHDFSLDYDLDPIDTHGQSNVIGSTGSDVENTGNGLTIPDSTLVPTSKDGLIVTRF